MQHRLRIEKFDDWLGLGDVAFITKSEDHARFHRHAEFYPHQRSQLQCAV